MPGAGTGRGLGLGALVLALAAGMVLGAGGVTWFQSGRDTDLAERLAEAERLGREAQAGYDRLAERLGGLADGAGAALRRVDVIADIGQRLGERIKVYEGIYVELVQIADGIDPP